MQAPVRSRKRDPRFEWTVKSDPQELDRMYIRLLGPGGDRMLTDEVKWLAVTHKSFDHGRRGYNDRLAFLGRRIVTLQASLAMISAASQHQSGVSSGGAEASLSDSSFAHPALEGVESLSHPALLDLLDKRRLAPLAMRCGLADVLRWLPKRPDNLLGSGEESVLTEALFAIVGAIALQKGGNEAAQVARDKILAPLGVTS
ncbi:MAG: hypothetical protein M1838_001362 [Thelocarpon superellum]|nr:MAG: hypothetical protein M1838_001362 [Thelocarpon superellum]